MRKTKELVIDFRTREHSTGTTVIHGEDVEIVSSYKYLGTIFDDKLSWDENTNAVVKNCTQRMYYLRKLNSFNVDRTIMKLFYSAFIESVLSFSFICCYFHLTVKNKKSLQGVVNTCSNVIGDKQRALTLFCEQQIVRKARSIIANPSHKLNSKFKLLPLGRRYDVRLSRTNRRKFTFVPVAINLLNK